MQPKHEFEAVLEAGDGDGGVFVVVPFSVLEVYGTKGQVPVQVTFDGYPYQGSITPLSDGHHALHVLKQIRKAVDKTIGDTVRVTLVRNVAERKMTPPDDLAEQLAGNPQAAAYFDKLAYTHQREFVRWLDGAKRPDTRAHRLAQTVELLSQGRKRA